MNSHQPPTHQGLPPPQPLHYPRPPAGGVHHHQQQLPHNRSPPTPQHQLSPQQSQHALHPTALSQGPYVSPHSSTHSLAPQHHQQYQQQAQNQHHQQQQQPPPPPPPPHHQQQQAPQPNQQSAHIVAPPSGIPHHHPHHHPGETSFFGAHPSPYSSHSAAGSYASSEPSDTMAATQAALNRQPYPPISSYQTPQSNSPASIHSPQTDAHGRPLYGMPAMAQQMYYPQQYGMQSQQSQQGQVPQQSHQSHHSPYSQHPSSSHHPSITSAPGMLMSHPSSHPQMQSQQSQQHNSSGQPGMLESKPSIGSLQRPPSVMGGSHGTPSTPTGPAPGPIPATTPLVVRQDNNGVQWIAFEYSRDRVKMEYTIRCDVESVNIEELSTEFKNANCVYPRACCGKDQYKGNRLHYETECNAVGWALAQLNPNLREKRGLIQRAVDSWRNSNQDPRLRSRRVRRMAKMNTRKHMGPGSASHMQGPGSGGLPPQAAHDYNGAPAHHHQPPAQGQGADVDSDGDVRYSQSFYPTYPSQPGLGAPGMPSIHDGMNPMHGSASTLAAPASASSQKEDEEETKRALFGDVPESKRRKFILVDDNQRGTRVRVRVMLDQVSMDDMPDAHLRINAVYPRSYFPRQMRSPPGSPRGRSRWDDEEDEPAHPGFIPTIGSALVPVSLMDATETKLAVPRMTKSRRTKEKALNELGYRMSWGQARTFNGRTLFLQRSLDAYRNKMRSTMVAAGQETCDIAPHFETRPGKRKWLERNKRARQDNSP